MSPEQAADSHLNFRAPVDRRAARHTGRVPQEAVGAGRNRASAVSGELQQRSHAANAARALQRVGGRTVQPRRASATRRAGSASLPARPAKRIRRDCVRAHHSDDARAARVSPAGHERRSADAAGLLQAGARGRQLRAGRRDGAARDADEPGVSVPHRARPAGATAGRTIASAISSSRRGLSFFLWSSIPDEALLDAAVQGTARATRPCSSSRCGECSRIRAPRRW